MFDDTSDVLEMLPPTEHIRERLSRVLNAERLLQRMLRAAEERDRERDEQARHRLPGDC